MMLCPKVPHTGARGSSGNWYRHDEKFHYFLASVLNMFVDCAELILTETALKFRKLGNYNLWCQYIITYSSFISYPISIK